jgi:streptogramin lyase
VFGTRSFIPRGITIDASGTVYVADLQGTIAKLGVDGKLATIAGTPGVSGAADGTGAAASFSAVYAMAVDTNGNLYAADYANHLIRKVNQAGVVTTLAGTRGSLTLQPGPLPGSLAGVSGIAVDKKGIVYATSGNAVIKITPAP